MRIRLFDHDELNFVQFTATDEEDSLSICTPNSKYLHGSVFSLFLSAFEMSNPDYNYYEAVSYNQNLVTLRNHLQDELSRLRLIKNAEDLEANILKQVEGIDFMNELKTFYHGWRSSWERIRNELIIVLEDLIEYVDYCIDDDKVLWVKGF